MVCYSCLNLFINQITENEKEYLNLGYQSRVKRERELPKADINEDDRWLPDLTVVAFEEIMKRVTHLEPMP